MMCKLKIVFLLLLFSLGAEAQELNATIVVNYNQVTNANPQVFKSLETQLREFMNTTRWTDLDIKERQRIEAVFALTINKAENNQFEATLQVQSSRLVFNSTYNSPILNINDKNFNFTFNEFEKFNYDPNTFDSNIVGVMAYYANLILALNFDTFSERGGDKYYKIANAIAINGQSSGYKGWSANESGNNNRFYVISDLMSSTFLPFRLSMYTYHINGMDLMADDPLAGKTGVSNAVLDLKKINDVRPNSLLMRMFFDAKADELVSIFSAGPIYTKSSDLRNTLYKISPLNATKWNAIK